MLKISSDLTSEQIGEAIRSFRAERCPFCNGKKISDDDAFCLECLEGLTPDLFAAVSDRKTFIEAFHPAMELLRTLNKDAQARNTRPRRYESPSDATSLKLTKSFYATDPSADQ